MLGGVFGAARVQQLPHAVLHGQRVHALLHDVVLVEHMAEEVAVVELVHHIALHVLRQLLHPFAVVAAQGDVQRHDVFDLAAVHLTVANGCACNRKAVQEGFAALLGIALKPAARRVRRRKVFGQKSACGFHLVVRYAHQQVVLVQVAPLAHAPGQVAGQQARYGLDGVVHKAAHPQAFKEPIEPALECKGRRHAGRAKAVDEQEGVLAVLLANVKRRAVDVFPGNGRAGRGGEQVAAHGGEVVGRVAADVEHRAGFLGEGVQPHGKQAHLACGARGLEQAGRVGIEAGGGVGIHGTHVLGVAGIGGDPAGVALDVGFGIVAALQACQDFFGRVAQRDAQVVHQLQRAVVLHAGIQGQFGVRRAAAHQRAARVVADAA